MEEKSIQERWKELWEEIKIEQENKRKIRELIDELKRREAERKKENEQIKVEVIRLPKTE